MKDVGTTFERVAIANKGSNLSKSIFGAPVTASSREIFMGEAANWKIKWKEVIKLEIDHCSVYLETDYKIVDLINADNATWSTFRLAIEKRWRKLQGDDTVNESKYHDSDPLEPSVKKTRTKRQYGSKASRHKRILQSAVANSRIMWSDDEGDTREMPPPASSPDTLPQEEDPALSHVVPSASDGDETVVMSDNDVHLSLSDNVEPPRSSRRAKKTKRRITKKVLDDDSDDEGLFNEAPITTPISRSLVTPKAVNMEDEESANQQDEPDMKNQAKVSDFFKAKPAADFFHPRPRATTNAASVSTKPDSNLKIKSQTPQVHTPLKADHASWIEGTPMRSTMRSTLQRTPKTPSKTPPPHVSPFEIRTPPRFMSRHFKPPNNLDPNRDSIEESDDDDVKGSHKRLRLSRRTFVNRRSGHDDSKADSVLDSAISTPRKIPFGLQIQTSASKRLTPTDVAVAIERAPSPPLTTKWKGLRNLGNTCYLNSSLQFLCTVPEFCTRLVGHGGNLSTSLAAVAKQLLDNTPSSSVAVTPRQLKEAVDADTNRFSGYEQRDAHEFLSFLIDQVHDELNETESKGDENKENFEPNESSSDTSTKAPLLLTDEFFQMKVQACLKCDSCGYERTMNEIYRHLSIEVNRHAVPEGDAAERPLWTVHDGLQKFFASEKRDVKCEKCHDGTTATQTLAITSQPKALILHLKRFVVRERPRISASHNRKVQESNVEAPQDQVVPPPVEMIIAKNKDQVVVAESFDLNAFVPKPMETSRKYKLSGMVHHHGSTPSSGHYTADAVRVDGHERQWVSFDDGSAWPADINKVLKSPHNQRNAYMLLYTLEES